MATATTTVFDPEATIIRDAPTMTATRVWVHLGDHEYANSTRRPDGSWTCRDASGQPLDNMWAAAREVFDAHPDAENLMVSVIEHGGWTLTYLRDKTIIGTANDRATLSDAAREFLDRLSSTPDVDWRYLPDVWRGR